MAKKKNARPKSEASVAASFKLGKAQGAEIVALRARQRRRREKALAAIPQRRRAPAPARIPAAIVRALGTRTSAGLLIAEGDSWFDYPLHDVLSLLEDDHGYDVESVAHKGDRVEDMAYSAGQFEEFARRLEKLLRNGRVPDAILLSGGGNDIAGEEFEVLINHAASGLPPINDDVVRGVIDVRLREAYAYMVGGLSEIAVRFLGRTIPILTHGYDYPIPDGRGFLGGFGPLPGPWLRPGFHRKGYQDQAANARIMRGLIDRFNAMLQAVSASPQFPHVRFVDLRGTLESGSTYKKDWGNELHPSGRGFDLVTAKIAAAIASL